MTDLRQYRMQLIAHVLGGGQQMATGAVHDHLVAAAEAAVHPIECYQMTRAEVAGLLRSMEAAGRVVVTGKTYRTARGRDEPMWTAAALVELPEPPEEEAAPTRTSRAVEIMTADRGQAAAEAAVAAVLQQASKVSSASARLQAEVDALNRQVSRLSKGAR